MGLVVNGSPHSTYSQIVLIVLAEKGVESELREIDFAVSEHKQPAFLKLQPFGLVPVLEDDGYFLYESRAIAKYIAKKYAGQGTKLMPEEADVKAYGLFEQACSVEHSYFESPVSAICYEKIFKSMQGMGATDEEAVKKHAAKLDATLAVYEGILAQHAYLAGDELTLADLFHLPYGTMVRGLGFTDVFAKYPNVAKWFDALEARESWQKVSGGK
ncbi:putative glutathione S-transferase [Leptodontidium sp. MPI-SDFR-AT-0119]|nr:putative glutathione S-transferase [Leptodontidium sp. MPI-SDFR-AT-0119]